VTAPVRGWAMTNAELAEAIAWASNEVYCAAPSSPRHPILLEHLRALLAAQALRATQVTITPEETK
jgi:hypothetical protein